PHAALKVMPCNAGWSCSEHSLAIAPPDHGRRVARHRRDGRGTGPGNKSRVAAGTGIRQRCFAAGTRDSPPHVMFEGRAVAQVARAQCGGRQERMDNYCYITNSYSISLMLNIIAAA